jgi:hypothetical protein
VIGILLIVFSSLGILGSLWGLLVSSAFDFAPKELPELKTFTTISKLTSGIDLILAIFGLVVGIMCVGYKRPAPKLAIVLAILKIVGAIVGALLVRHFMNVMLDAMASHGRAGREAGEFMGVFANFGMVFGIIIGVAWPTVILALMSRPSAKSACVN